MNDGQRFEKALEEKPWDTDTRLIYADWLEEYGFDDEAAYQRKFAESRHWMREFAKKHHTYGRYHDWEKEEKEGKNRYDEEVNVNDLAEEYLADFLHFLEQHSSGGGYLGFDTPHHFNEYSEEMWKHFEVVTGKPSPEGKFRTTRPPFRCGC